MEKTWNQDKAFEKFVKYFRRTYGTDYQIRKVNKNRHMLVLGKKNFYVVYKREYFNTATKQFASYVEKDPIAKNSLWDSLNKEALKIAVANEATLVLVHPHETYFGDPLTLLRFCAINNLRRSQDRRNIYKVAGGNYRDVSEETFSFPVNYHLDKVDLQQSFLQGSP